MKKITLLVILFTITLCNLNAQRECGTSILEEIQQNNPEHATQLQQIETHTQEWIDGLSEHKSASVVVTIPVVFHVIHTGTTSSENNIQDSYIFAQLEQMNDDFRRFNSDADNTWSQAADSEIEFCLATTDPSGNATTGINRYQYTTGTWSTNQIDNTIKPATIWNRNDYLNIWLIPDPFVPNSQGTLLGYAQFPGGSASTDGVVNRTSTTGSLSTPNPLGLFGTGMGRTSTHEVGHWLNLRHIWGDGPCSFDDGVSDTPASDDSNQGCAIGHVSCGSVDMIQNYMDYSDDDCMNLFTTGQKNRMQALLNGGFRSSLLNSSGCSGGGGACDNQGGDNDGDGVCANVDCNDNNASVGAQQNPGTTCNDNDPNTIDDVIQADGCTCQGVPDTGGGGYCTSQGTNTSYEYIQSINVANINNNSGDDGGYGNYTSQTATVSTGTSYNITLTPGFVTTAYTEYWKVWVDFNQDGDFEDAGEELLNQNSTTVINSSITIPASAPSGDTRMRISMKYNAAPSSCEVFADGEVEDYTISIGGPACNVGSPCNDNNVCTVNDIYDANCDCNGTFQDSDNDGICDANDECPNFNDNLIGTPCDDNNVCTVNDTYDANCTCSGIVQDSDNDGICDANDECPTDPTNTCNDPGTYCASQGTDTNYEYIQNVNISSINNTSGDDGGYADYTAQNANVNTGTTYTVVLTPGFVTSAYTEYWKIWVDFNQDGDFEDAGEELLNANSNATITSSITIPASAQSGATRMRVSMKYNATSTPCETFQYGEVEDYTITIGGAACNVGAPCDDNNICTINDVYDANCNCNGTFQDSDNDGICDANDECPNDPTNTCNDPNTYCASQGNDTTYEYIENVNVASINNTSGNDGGYGDYTAQNANVNAGTSYVILLTPGFVTSAYTEYWKVWVDFNQDGDFEDAGEELLNENSNAAINSTISIPASAPSGSTRMRVTMQYNAAPNSCGAFTYGEVEDYTINITNGNKIADETALNIRNYPNPFNDFTNIEFSLLNDGPVTLHVYDLAGRRVATLLDNEPTIAGENRVRFDGSGHPSGMYIYTIQAGEYTGTGKMNLMK